MKVLIFGPSGSGKSYTVKALKHLGINAVDDCEIEGLSKWYDQHGNKVADPLTADEAIKNQYAFLWSKKAMAAFLAKFQTVYVFGGSGNVSSVMDLFDKVCFLKVDPELQRERLRSPERPNSLMDVNAEGPIIWGEWLEELARSKNIPFIDASQSPEQIFMDILS